MVGGGGILTGYRLKPGLRRAAAAAFAVAAMATLVLTVERPVWGGQPQPHDQRTGTAEVIPLPAPSGARPTEPLADLITDGEYKDAFRGIGQLTVDIRPRDIRQGKPLGDMPPDVASAVLTRQAQTNGGNCRRDWPRVCFHWEPSGLCYQPLYFEETNLERYGYSPRGLRLVQPLLSAGNFFLTVPLLPYKMAAQPPRQEIYTLGQYRPGSPVPYRINRPQFRLAGVVAEAAAIGGLILLIP
jgi:hypothetical protein